MNHYFRAFSLLACLFVLSLGSLSFGLLRSLRAHEMRAELSAKASSAELAAEGAERLLLRRQAQAPAAGALLLAWKPQLDLGAEEKDIALVLRSGLEGLAQRKLGLVTDQATTPEQLRLPLGSKGIPVQRVAIRASGDNLSALMAWVGEVEHQYSLARVDALELSAGTGPNAALKLTLSHPVLRKGAPFLE